MSSKLHAAAVQGDIGTLQLFLEDEDVNSTSKFGRTLLHSASQKGQLKVVQQLLERGAEPEIRDKHGRTALHVAAHSGFSVLVAELCTAGANTESNTSSGRTALHLAAWEGHCETCQALVDNGAKLESRDQSGKTPLHLAAWNGQLEVARLLLRSGADAESKDEAERTPALVAAKFGHGDILHDMWAAGADLNAVDDKGQSSQEIAAAAGFNEVAELAERLCRSSKMPKGSNRSDRKGIVGKALQLTSQRQKHNIEVDVGVPSASRNKGSLEPIQVVRVTAGPQEEDWQGFDAGAKAKNNVHDDDCDWGRQVDDIPVTLKEIQVGESNKPAVGLTEPDVEGGKVLIPAKGSKKVPREAAAKLSAQLPKKSLPLARPQLAKPKAKPLSEASDLVSSMLESLQPSVKGSAFSSRYKSSTTKGGQAKIKKSNDTDSGVCENKHKVEHNKLRAGARENHKFTAKSLGTDNLDLTAMLGTPPAVARHPKPQNALEQDLGTQDANASAMHGAPPAKDGQLKLHSGTEPVAESGKQATGLKERRGFHAVEHGTGMVHAEPPVKTMHRVAFEVPGMPKPNKDSSQKLKPQKMKANGISSTNKAAGSKSMAVVQGAAGATGKLLTKEAAIQCQPAKERRQLAEVEAALATAERQRAEEAMARQNEAAQAKELRRELEIAKAAAQEAASLRSEAAQLRVKRDAAVAAARRLKADEQVGSAPSELELLMELEEMRMRLEEAEAERDRLLEEGDAERKAGGRNTHQAQILQGEVSNAEQVLGRMAAEEAELASLQKEYQQQQQDMSAHLARLQAQMIELEVARAELEEGEGRREALEGRLDIARDTLGAQLSKNSDRADALKRAEEAQQEAKDSRLQAEHAKAELMAERKAGKSLQMSLELLQRKLHHWAGRVEVSIEEFLAVEQNSASYRGLVAACEADLEAAKDGAAVTREIQATKARLVEIEQERNALAAEREEMRSRAASAEQEAEAARRRETETRASMGETAKLSARLAEAEEAATTSQQHKAEALKKVEELEAVIRAHVAATEETRQLATTAQEEAATSARQAKWAETRLAQEQEESERLRKSASEEKLHAEAAIRDLSIGVAEMLSRPANRKAWPPEIAEAVERLEIAASRNAVEAATDGPSIEQAMEEAAAAAQEAVVAKEERLEAQERAAAAEERRHRLEAELVAREYSFQAAAEAAEEKWQRRLESVQRSVANCRSSVSKQEQKDKGVSEICDARRMHDLEAELHRCRERARALLEEKDQEIFKLKASQPPSKTPMQTVSCSQQGASSVTTSAALPRVQSAGAEDAAMVEAVYMQQVVSRGIESGNMRVFGALGNVLRQLTLQPPAEIDVVFFQGVLTKALEAADEVVVEPPLQDALLHILGLDPEHRAKVAKAQDVARNAGSMFASFFG